MKDSYIKAANDLSKPMQTQLVEASMLQPEMLKTSVMVKVLQTCKDLTIQAEEKLVVEEAAN